MKLRIMPDNTGLSVAKISEKGDVIILPITAWAVKTKKLRDDLLGTEIDISASPVTITGVEWNYYTLFDVETRRWWSPHCGKASCGEGYPELEEQLLLIRGYIDESSGRSREHDVAESI